jgi:hypothetical protein
LTAWAAHEGADLAATPRRCVVAPAGHRFADDFLSRARPIHLGGVEVRHPAVQSGSVECYFSYCSPEHGDGLAGRVTGVSCIAKYKRPATTTPPSVTW